MATVRSEECPSSIIAIPMCVYTAITEVGEGCVLDAYTQRTGCKGRLAEYAPGDK
jgi:hypothetical protein